MNLLTSAWDPGNYSDVTILIVEDNEGDARLIREMLNETDYVSAQFHTFGTLHEAREAPIAHNSVATILLDLNLPDSEGINTLRGIKEPYADSAIIVLTGLDDEKLAIQALREGAQNYLTKDQVHPSMLGRTLRHSIERHRFIQRLRENHRVSEERDHRFRMLIEHSGDLTLVVEQEGGIAYASPAVRRAFGYRKNQVLNVFSLIHPDDEVATRSSMEQVLLRPGMPLPMVLRAKACDGQFIWLEGTINNLVDMPGVHGIVVNFHDITDRINLEHRIAFDRSNLDALINSTQDLVWSVDRNLHLIAANEAFLQALTHATGSRPRPGDDLMQIRDTEGISPTEHWRGLYERALAGESFKMEEHITQPVEVYSEMSYAPIVEGTAIVGVACFSRDVTKRRLMEEHLRRNEATMAHAQAIAHFGSWELNIDRLDDPNTGPHAWSDEVYRIVGLDPGTAEASLKTFFDLVHKDDLSDVKSALEGTMAAGTPYSIDHRIVRPDGSVRWVHEDGALVLGPGKLRRVLGTVHDITERVALEQRITFDRSNLNALINSTQDLVWSVDRDLRLITANDAFLTIMEQTAGVRLKLGDSLMVPDVDGASPTEHWRALYQRALMGETFTLEEHMTNPVEAYNAINYAPIRNGKEVVGVAVFSRNITEIRKAQKELERSYMEVLTSELQKTSILDALPANIALLDREGDIVAVNEQWRAFAVANGYRGNEHGVGSNYAEVARRSTGMDAEMGVVAAEGIDMVAAGTRAGFSMEYPCDAPAEKRWFRMQASPLAAKGEQGTVVMHIDITDRKVAEERIQQLNRGLEDRVLERTKELIEVNADLEEEVVKNRDLSGMLAARNKDFMDSINYARHIQDALFPTQPSIGFFSALACFSKPRNVVSGDFLWQYAGRKHTFIAIGDCTGHGVPGALMSMLAHSLLNQMVMDRQLVSPQMVLIEMDQALEDLFTQHASETRVYDGMDMGFLALDRDTLELTFGGALLRCMILRNGEMIRLECSRHSIGGHVPHIAKEFTQARFPLRKGDRIVLSTDGYYSQFGGPEGRKMKAQQFRDLLRNTAQYEAAEARNILEREFVQWMGKEEQVDDVLVVILDV